MLLKNHDDRLKFNKNVNLLQFEPTTSLHLQYRTRDVKQRSLCTLTATVCECNLKDAVISR